MIKISLRQLEIFRAIAQIGNVTKAAMTIGLTQSAASMALKELEHTLNAPLFHRQGKRLVLNQLGKTLLKEADFLLGRAKAIDQLNLKQGALAGELKIGASSTIGNYIFPAYLVRFKQQYPEVSIELNVANTDTIIQNLNAWRIDLGFIEGECYEPKINKEAWLEDELVIFCRKNHPLSKHKTIPMQALANYPWILRELGSGTLETVDALLLKKLKLDTPWLRLGSSQAIKLAVKSSNALSVLSKFVLQEDLEDDNLKILRIEKLKLMRPLYEVSLKDRFETHLVKTFKKFIRQPL
jgi:DNA-binding transcriptional LysR family regulator